MTVIDAGAPHRPSRQDTPTARVLALDVGGTKLAAGIVDREGTLTARHVTATLPRAAGQGDELWATVGDLLTEVLDAAAIDPEDLGGLAGIGVGCGGPMRWPAGAVSPINLPAWRDFPLRDRLVERFPGLPVRLHNDAIAMVAAEHAYGAGRGVDALLGVVVSTGVGGGLVLGGRILDGATGNAGHVGHVVVDPDGPACGCGGRGCLEAIARGPALVARALDQGWRPADPEAAADGRSLATSARTGDPVATAAFDRAGRALGTALASVAALLELERVVVGGGIGSVGDLLLDPARAAFREHARMGFAARCEIVPAALGTDAGLVGAAALVLGGDRYWSVPTAEQGAD